MKSPIARWHGVDEAYEYKDINRYMNVIENLLENYCFSGFPCCSSSKGILTSLSPSAIVFSGVEGSFSASDCYRDAKNWLRILNILGHCANT